MDRTTTTESGATPATVRDGLAIQALYWLREGVRTGVLRRPRWEGLVAGPAVMLVLFAISVGAAVGLQRLWVVGPADFNLRTLLFGWLSTLLAAWLCYALYLRRTGDPAIRAPGAAHLFCLLLAQGCFLAVVFLPLGALAVRVPQEVVPPMVWWGAWIAALGVMGLAHWLVLMRGTGRRVLAAGAAVLVLGMNVFEGSQNGEALWVARESDSESSDKREWLRLTQGLMERQPKLLAERLQELEGQRPGEVELYALTFAPYGYEDVFRRESAMVAEVMQQRFGAGRHTLQLVNSVDTLEQWPWATPLNLERAIHHVAHLMDREEDILFLHLTSHGAADGELAASFWPMTVEAITPEILKQWLDQAGIRNRVISVSACYSGNWIEPLADEHTLVMTAADAENTSYGCGRRSELTYFGRAVFDEQLRSHTRSFAEAHAAARPLIEQREKEAGKDDGYSNPQIRVGSAIEERLRLLERRLGDAPARP
ncbi:C13 family peptidase [Pseudothauera rhizosphaerae]|uniref:Peptidase C13 family protein n=1 Tax=Pseudothauera rhizosphaerae TaxID=2565932 RepID=A0A4S4AL58_9RHOO|nr:C13 family peptidase [Pseudothauera rhizosphaerae]THF60188.1 hypothetical protein E6O51_14785 [Pseudothauera rhizosphaerae]